ncbi:uncharacterized protein LOC111696117 [Eurytemora carolleeae]|uniref:uncharacterized protein LOC111696117 n=1 Tax=Eurytemora carolleeae TaxID=1294199 RepID=UPI000C7881D4|nr:uncharacterized protein LOC111696117 [Eurytemora carolleeae]|eukprot:XP_023321430.1 uncharacterized protein LOC111696117 [Eurytemora affinis]
MVLCGPNPPSLIDARGIALPQGEGVSSYGTVVGEGGGGGGLFHEVRTPSSGVPSIAQLHRHLSNTTQDVIDKAPTLSGSPVSTPPGGASEPHGVPRLASEPLSGGLPRTSPSNNTLSSQNLSLHDSNIKDIKETLDLDQTTMIGSALDLDSLDGDQEQQIQEQRRKEKEQFSHVGSQMKLSKLSAV